jgi:hypothetical protein
LTYVLGGPVEPSSTSGSVASLPATLGRERPIARTSPAPSIRSDLMAIFPRAEAATAFEPWPLQPPTRPATHEGTVIAFISPSVVTSEKALAAVVVLERSPPRHGALRVRWAARSGTADAAIDFSDASGTARFADGQSQLALYVPLRNDLIRESDESFDVCLDRAQARSRSPRCAAVTIRDDD